MEIHQFVVVGAIKAPGELPVVEASIALRTPPMSVSQIPM
jgi:hypothetical protein